MKLVIVVFVVETQKYSCCSDTSIHLFGRHVELRQTLESVSKSCPLIERIYFESSKTGRDDSLKLPTCNDLVNNCPYLTSLALRGFKLHDPKVRVLVKVCFHFLGCPFSCSTFSGEWSCNCYAYPFRDCVI